MKKIVMLPTLSPSTRARVLVDGPGYHEKERPSRLLKMLDLSVSDCSGKQLDTLKALLSHHTDILKWIVLSLATQMWYSM